MKTRTAFVSNSSSASFVIAVKGASEKFDKYEPEMPGLIRFARAMLEEVFRGGMITSKEDLDAHFLFWVEEDDIDKYLEAQSAKGYDFYAKTYQKELEKIEEGYTLFSVDVDYEVCEAFNALDDGDTVIILETA